MQEAIRRLLVANAGDQKPASANMVPSDQPALVNESAAAPASPGSASTGSDNNVPPQPPGQSLSSYPADNTVAPTEISSNRVAIMTMQWRSRLSALSLSRDFLGVLPHLFLNSPVSII